MKSQSAEELAFLISIFSGGNERLLLQFKIEECPFDPILPFQTLISQKEPLLRRSNGDLIRGKDAGVDPAGGGECCKCK